MSLGSGRWSAINVDADERKLTQPVRQLPGVRGTTGRRGASHPADHQSAGQNEIEGKYHDRCDDWCDHFGNAK